MQRELNIIYGGAPTKTVARKFSIRGVYVSAGDFVFVRGA